MKNNLILLLSLLISSCAHYGKKDEGQREFASTPKVILQMSGKNAEKIFASSAKFSSLDDLLFSSSKVQGKEVSNISKMSAMKNGETLNLGNIGKGAAEKVVVKRVSELEFILTYKNTSIPMRFSSSSFAKEVKNIEFQLVSADNKVVSTIMPGAGSSARILQAGAGQAKPAKGGAWNNRDSYNSCTIPPGASAHVAKLATELGKDGCESAEQDIVNLTNDPVMEPQLIDLSCGNLSSSSKEVVRDFVKEGIDQTIKAGKPKITRVIAVGSFAAVKGIDDELSESLLELNQANNCGININAVR